jgi:hypothetical protein
VLRGASISLVAPAKGEKQKSARTNPIRIIIRFAIVKRFTQPLSLAFLNYGNVSAYFNPAFVCAGSPSVSPGGTKYL